VDEAELGTRLGPLTQVQHPNVGLVLGLERSGDDWFLVCEAVPGARLDVFLGEARERSLPLRSALDVGVQLCDALAALHGAGVAHGEVRPSHVALGEDGRVRLTGFDLTGSGERPADDPYRAPEGGSSATTAADCYALGVLLYELLSGVPSRGVALHLRAALSLDESFPDEVRRAVVAASHPDPAVRPPVAEVRARLAAARDALPTRPDRTRTTTTSSGSGSLRPIAPAGPPTRIGRYDVVRELGRGGAGVVYEATDTELRRRVALKVLLSGTFARARELQRFKQEAQAVARLDHEGIVKVLDIGSHVDGAWFAMEFVDGPSLMDRVRAEGHLGWEEAVRIAAVVARALAHAHGAGLLHRDVKPHNVLLERGREPKLADFGLALAADADVTRLTGTGQILGTPMYMAPEQATGDLRALGPHTDVYALGVTLYESLTGKVPFEGATPLQVIGRILRGNPRPPREHLAALPRSVELAVLKAIRLEPQDRYPTAAAFAEDLERCLRGEPLTAAEPTWGERGAVVGAGEPARARDRQPRGGGHVVDGGGVVRRGGGPGPPGALGARADRGGGLGLGAGAVAERARVGGTSAPWRSCSARTPPGPSTRAPGRWCGPGGTGPGGEGARISGSPRWPPPTPPPPRPTTRTSRCACSRRRPARPSATRCWRPSWTRWSSAGLRCCRCRASARCGGTRCPPTTTSRGPPRWIPRGPPPTGGSCGRWRRPPRWSSRGPRSCPGPEAVCW
jgi:serine/threonine protein kinase